MDRALDELAALPVPLGTGHYPHLKAIAGDDPAAAFARPDSWQATSSASSAASSAYSTDRTVGR